MLYLWVLVLSVHNAVADECDDDYSCLAGLKNGLTLDEEFEVGTITRCLHKRHGVKMLMQLNTLFQPGSATLPYGLVNLPGIIVDYEVTNGMSPEYYVIAVFIYG